MYALRLNTPLTFNFLLNATPAQLANVEDSLVKDAGESGRIEVANGTVRFVFRSQLAALRMAFHLSLTPGIFVDEAPATGEWFVGFSELLA